jgi:hypothetical protein
MNNGKEIPVFHFVDLKQTIEKPMPVSKDMPKSYIIDQSGFTYEWE